LVAFVVVEVVVVVVGVVEAEFGFNDPSL